MSSSFDYFEHEADIGIIGMGDTLEEAFVGGARALFNIMVDIDRVEPVEKIEVSCSAFNLDELFVEWLNTLLAEADIREMVFSEFAVSLGEGKLHGYACGERLEPEKHNVKTEVKAATYSMLRVEQRGDKFFAECVIDV